MKLLKMAVIMIGIYGLIPSAGCAMNVKETPKGSPKNYQAQDWFTDPKEIDFCHAIEWEDTNRMQKLLDGGLNINTLGNVKVNYFGKIESNRVTFLNWAYIKQKKASYQYLLEYGADPNIMEQDVEKWGGSDILVHFSVISLLAGRPEDPFYLSMALKHGGNPNAVIDKVSLIFKAINSESLTNVQLLVEAGADVNGKYGGANPLYSAVIASKYDIAYYLIEKGANPEIDYTIDTIKKWYLADIEPDNLIPEMRIQAEWRLKVIKLLEEKGIDLSGVTNK